MSVSGYFVATPITLTPVVGNGTVEASSTQIYIGIQSIHFQQTFPLPPPTDAGAPSVWGFVLNRTIGSQTSAVGMSTGTNINNGAGWAFLDTTAVPGTNYTYFITVYDPVSGVENTLYGPGGVALAVQSAPALNYNTTLTASGITKSSVTITPATWNPAGNPWSNSVPLDFTGYTYAWYRSTTLGVMGSALSGQTSINLTDATVSAATTYYYTAQISDGYSTANSVQTPVTTLSGTIVAGLPTLTSYNSSQVIGQIGSVTGGVPPYTYQWKRSTTSGSGYTNLTGQTNTTLTDNTPAAATEYYYVYVVTDSASDTTTSSQFSVTTYATLTVATPTQTSVTATTATLGDTGAAGGSGTYLYQWYRSTVSNFSPSTGNLLTGQTGLTLTDSGLVPSTNYFYVIVATDLAGDSATSTALSVNTSAGPLAIGPLAEINVSTVSATVSAPTPTGGVPAYSYAWFRSAVAGSTGVTLTFTTQTITDFGADLTPQGLLPDTTYYYTCTVTDSAVPTPNVVSSVQLAVTTAVPDALGAYYAGLLIYQYVTQPNASATIQAIAGALTLPAASTQTADNVLPLVVQNAFNLPTATGAQLNIIGRYQGVTRSVTTATGSIITLDDRDFRTLITLASANKLATQSYNGVTVPSQSLAGIDYFLITNFPGTIYVTDLLDMEIGYLINSTSIGSTNLLNAVISEDLLPKPLGVLISYIIVNPTLTFFGFSTVNNNGTSFSSNALTSPFNNATTGFLVGPWLDATMNYL